MRKPAGPNKLRSPIVSSSLSASRYKGSGGNISINRELLAESIKNAKNKQKPLFDLDARLKAAEKNMQPLNIKNATEAFNLFRKGQLQKADLSGIVYWLGYVNNPDDISFNQAFKILDAAANGKEIPLDEYDKVIKEHTNILTSNNTEYVERKIRINETNRFSNILAIATRNRKLKLTRRRKGQYTQDAYTGNATQKPGEIDTQLETAEAPKRYDKKKKDVQPKPGSEDTEEPRNVHRRDRFGDEYKEAQRKQMLSTIVDAIDELDADDLNNIKNALLGEDKDDDYDISPDDFFSKADDEIKQWN